jgi:hypothetical protein
LVLRFSSVDVAVRPENANVYPVPIPNPYADAIWSVSTLLQATVIFPPEIARLPSHEIPPLALPVPIAADSGCPSTETEPLQRTTEAHRPFTGVPMPAPARPEALTATEPREIAARLTFEFCVHTICRNSLLPSKTRTAEELEIVTALFNFTSVKRTETLESDRETEVEALPVTVTENGRVFC